MYRKNASSHFKLAWLDLLLVLSLGTGIFFLVCSAKILNPSNLAFIGPYDPTMHYLGWAVFRNGPWTWPLGLNPHYGLDISSSIVYSDAIPFLAIFFKALRSHLPETFQYFGWWYLACCLLQAWFAYLLIARITTDRIVRLLGAALLSFAPIFFWRIGEHAALAGQFVLLAALYMALKPNRDLSLCKSLKPLSWGVLLIICAGINSYLLLMVLAVWGGSIIDSYLYARSKNVSLLNKQVLWVIGIELLVLTVLAVVLWIFGYFALAGGASTGSYGAGKMNLLAIFDPSGWSKWLPNLPQKSLSNSVSDQILSRMEGFNYLGLGNIALLFFALMGLYWNAKARGALQAQLRHHKGLLFTFSVLSVLAISNNVSIGAWNIHVPLPEKIYHILGIVRASGRLFWPIWYALVFTSIYVVFHSYSRQATRVILFCALALQVYDAHPGWKSLHQRLSVENRMQLFEKKQHSFWSVVPQCYQSIEVVPLKYGQRQAHWDWIGSYASEHRLKTNAVFLARADSAAVDRANSRYYQMLVNQDLPVNSLYILDQSMVIPALIHKRADDLLVSVDQFTILAPNWLSCSTKTHYNNSGLMELLLSDVKTHQNLAFSKGGLGVPFLIDVGISEHTDLGWGYPEVWGAWAAGEQASVVMPLPKGQQVNQLTLELRALIAPSVPLQKYSLSINGMPFITQTLTQAQGNQLVIPITPAMNKVGFIALNFRFFNRVRPKDIGIGNDDRNLSIGLVSARFE